MTRALILALALSISCGNSSTKRSASIGQNNHAHIDNSILYSVPQSTDIVVGSMQFNQLDTITASWRMTEDDVHSFFKGAIPITNTEVAEKVSKNYYPFSVTGKVTLRGHDYDYVINPVGVAVLFPSSFDENSQYTFVRNDTYKISAQGEYTSNQRLKILSYNKKSYEYDDELGLWYKDWWMSATDIDDYFKLCRPWDESTKGSVVTLFDNYNCDISGYLEMEGELYHYLLWCNGPFFLTPTKEDGYLERQSYVCQDDVGLKYLYAIEKNPTLDI